MVLDLAPAESVTIQLVTAVQRKKEAGDGVERKEERCSLNRSSFFLLLFCPSAVHRPLSSRVGSMAAVELSCSWFSAVLPCPLRHFSHSFARALISSHSFVPFVWIVKREKKPPRSKQKATAKPGFHNPWTFLSCRFLLLKGTKDLTVSPCLE